MTGLDQLFLNLVMFVAGVMTGLMLRAGDEDDD